MSVSCVTQSRFSNIFRVSAPDMVPWGKLRVDSDRGGSYTSHEPINILGLTEHFFCRSISSIQTPLCVCAMCHTESISNIFRVSAPDMVLQGNLGLGYHGGGSYTSANHTTCICPWEFVPILLYVPMSHLCLCHVSHREVVH